MIKTIAVVIDGEVQEVLNFDERVAAMLLSNPTLVDITEHSITSGWEYDGNSFSTTVDGAPVNIPLY